MQPTISTMPVVTALLVFVAAAVFAANTPLFGATDAIDASEVQILQSGRVFALAKGCLTFLRPRLSVKSQPRNSLRL
jgi:hypothetical protein